MNLLEKKIFIVDDNQFVSEMFNQHLTQQGYTDVIQFNNEITAMNNLVEDPDIVFLDYQMETLNGFEVLNKIKRFNPNIIVVMVSGQDDMNIAINSLKHGAFDYIIKGENELNKIDDVLNRIEFYLKEVHKRKPSILRNVRSLFLNKYS